VTSVSSWVSIHLTTSLIARPVAPAANSSGASSLRASGVQNRSCEPSPPRLAPAAAVSQPAICEAPVHVVQDASGLQVAHGRPVERVGSYT